MNNNNTKVALVTGASSGIGLTTAEAAFNLRKPSISAALKIIWLY